MNRNDHSLVNIDTAKVIITILIFFFPLETAMGVKLNSNTEPDNYREMIYRSGELLFKRYINPIYYNDTIFRMTNVYRELYKCVKRLHDFSRSVINQRRELYRHKAITSTTHSKENM